jgi:hypothetical protein
MFLIRIETSFVLALKVAIAWTDSYGVLLIRIVNKPGLSLLATARSGFPSKFRSAAAREIAEGRPEKAIAARNVPLPLPKSTETLLAVELAVARS